MNAEALSHLVGHDALKTTARVQAEFFFSRPVEAGRFEGINGE